jgi:hypothetical protein
MKRNLTVLAIAALLIGTLATDASARGGFGGGHVGGGFHGIHGGPYMGGVISTPPIFNPSSGYTVPPSPETPVSPASPGSVFGNG